MLYMYLRDLCAYRGESFRHVLSRVGEVRSLIPNDVTMMALTATATSQLRVKVTEMLGMKDELVVSLSPCKANIMYATKKFTTIAETFSPMLA